MCVQDTQTNNVYISGKKKKKPPSLHFLLIMEDLVPQMLLYFIQGVR